MDLFAEYDFSLQNLKAKIDQTSGYLGSKAPIIGISTNHIYPDENVLTHTYCDSIKHAGGIPLVIPMTYDLDLIMMTLSRSDGLIMTGGADAHPLWFGEEPNNKLGKVNLEKDYYDLALIMGALKKGLPILGICRGLQLLNIALGGTLIQDLSSQREETLGHTQTATRYELWQKAIVNNEGRLAEILGVEGEIFINSFHHQALDKVPDCGVVCARSTDGTIEAVDYYPEHNAIGVQWHPEALACGGKTIHLNIFKHLVREAGLYKGAKFMHNHFITIDSHVDTPSILVGSPCDNEVSKVDYAGMVNGGLDLAIMAAYVPQGEDSEVAYRQVIEMLDAIDRYADESKGNIVVLEDLSKALEQKKFGIKMIAKAVENAYVIGDNLDRLSDLAERGVKYITLCHNGDNQICDSAAKSKRKHKGLSEFGREVIKEMNKLNITVDVSHASDETIRNVLEVSTKPIIASHSSCKALYDHPRNLSDELIKAIADKGGVIQLCMYHGFIAKENPSVSDFVDHIDHAVKIAGIEHVGIGTDFDGGGEVIGCRESSSLHRITIELLRRGYNKPQLEAIWGGNLLRILS